MEKFLKNFPLKFPPINSSKRFTWEPTRGKIFFYIFYRCKDFIVFVVKIVNKFYFSNKHILPQ